MSLRTALADAGCTGWVHALDLDTGAEVGLDPDTPVVAASVFKLPVLVELCRRYAGGELDPRQRVRVAADERRSPGGTGISVALDDVELSLRDLAVLMMSVSDNRATDVVLDLVGRERVNEATAALGFPGTVLEADCQGLFDSMDADLGGSWAAYAQAEPEGPLWRTMRAVTPARTNRTTPRETTGLLATLWREDVLPGDVCAEARRVLGLQVWPHRLSSGFPEPGVRISAKTGTLAHLRSEAGVIEYPDGGRYAVAVFVSAATQSSRNPAADRVIGTVGRLAVDTLRGVTTPAAAPSAP